MSKDLEQKQEHVSENPETTITQDTERATSSEVEKTTELPPEESKPCEEEITPHEKQTEKSDGTVKSIEEKSEPEIDVTEVYIDMSKIEFDEEGIPVFNDNDKARLKTSDIVFNNFELEIEDAKEAIRNARKELDIESQNSREENAKNGIKEATAKLEEISKLSEDEITEEIKNEKSQLEGAVDLYKTIIETLPKNNEKIKKELEKRIENSIKYIATYQNVSRVNLQKLQNDGTIAALISSTANTAFAQAFIDSIRKSKGQTTIDEDPEIKKISDEINKIKMDYEFKKMLFNAYTELGEVKLDFIIKHAKELADPEHVAEAEVAEAIDYKKLKEIPYIIESINPISNGNEDEANKKYEEVRTSLISVEENELDNIKEARRIETEYLDEMTKFKNAVFVLNEFGARPNKIPVISCNILKYSDPEEINKFRDNLKEKITTDWNTISEKYDSLEDKLEETKESLITSLKTFVKKNGLFSSFVSYAFANSETRGYYGRSESLLDFSHEDIFGNRYYDCIKAIMKNDSEEEYNHVKTNVNSVSMMLNNIIK